MQKILALLLLIGLINALGNDGGAKVGGYENSLKMEFGNVEAAKTVGGSGKERIIGGEEKGNEYQLEMQLEKFDACMKDAVDNEETRTTCFRESMGVFANIGNKEERKIAELAEEIIGCKNGEGDIGDCIFKASNEKGLEGEAKETFGYIKEALKAQKEFVRILEEEAAEFEKNYKCEDVMIENEKGEKIKTQKCTPTETYQKSLDEFKKKHDEEFNRTVQTDEVDFDINGKTQTVKLYRPTEVAINEQIAQNDKTVKGLQKILEKEQGEGEEVTEEEKKVIQNIIDAITAQTAELREGPEDLEVLKERMQEQFNIVSNELKKIAEE